MLTKDAMAWFWDHYAPDPAARLHPEAAPLRAGFFYQLPPTVILTAEHDVLRDEGELYATQLMKVRVPVLHQRFAGQMHGFFTMTGLLPGAPRRGWTSSWRASRSTSRRVGRGGRSWLTRTRRPSER
jgi:acetyl esterase